jgi:hypothetical protein
VAVLGVDKGPSSTLNTIIFFFLLSTSYPAHHILNTYISNPEEAPTLNMNTTAPTPNTETLILMFRVIADTDEYLWECANFPGDPSELDLSLFECVELKDCDWRFHQDVMAHLKGKPE